MRLMKAVVVFLLVALMAIPASAEFVFPEFDLGGKTVNLWLWFEYEEKEIIAEAEELFNVKIELPQVGWEQQAETYMSSFLQVIPNMIFGTVHINTPSH